MRRSFKAAPDRVRSLGLFPLAAPLAPGRPSRVEVFLFQASSRHIQLFSGASWPLKFSIAHQSHTEPDSDHIRPCQWVCVQSSSFSVITPTSCWFWRSRSQLGKSRKPKASRVLEQDRIDCGGTSVAALFVLVSDACVGALDVGRKDSAPAVPGTSEVAVRP